MKTTNNNTDYSAIFTIRMSQELYETFNKFIEENSLNRSAFLRKMLEESMKNYQK